DVWIGEPDVQGRLHRMIARVRSVVADGAGALEGLWWRDAAREHLAVQSGDTAEGDRFRVEDGLTSSDRAARLGRGIVARAKRGPCPEDRERGRCERRVGGVQSHRIIDAQEEGLLREMSWTASAAARPQTAGTAVARLGRVETHLEVHDLLCLE